MLPFPAGLLGFIFNLVDQTPVKKKKIKKSQNFRKNGKDWEKEERDKVENTNSSFFYEFFFFFNSVHFTRKAVMWKTALQAELRTAEFKGKISVLHCLTTL